MAIHMTARWKCRQGAADKAGDVLEEFVKSIAGNEPGTRLYSALQNANDSNSFMTFFIFEDENAREYHQSTEWVKRFTDTIYPDNANGVEFTEYSLVALTEA